MGLLALKLEGRSPGSRNVGSFQKLKPYSRLGPYSPPCEFLPLMTTFYGSTPLGYLKVMPKSTCQKVSSFSVLPNLSFLVMLIAIRLTFSSYFTSHVVSPLLDVCGIVTILRSLLTTIFTTAAFNTHMVHFHLPAAGIYCTYFLASVSPHLECKLHVCSILFILTFFSPASPSWPLPACCKNPFTWVIPS